MNRKNNIQTRMNVICNNQLNIFKSEINILLISILKIFTYILKHKTYTKHIHTANECTFSDFRFYTHLHTAIKMSFYQHQKHDKVNIELV